jgi:ATP/maltotriose-dependent transcriptional regulator MalT
VFAIDRAREWSVALTEWCNSQPDLVEFNSLCRVHRAEILETQGAWQTAMDELLRANRPGALPVEAAAVCYRRGELMRLRGDFDSAEDAYREASKHGREPQPGLALLRLAQGKNDAAGSAIRQVLAATRDAYGRVRYLPAAVEILIAVGDREAAATAASELAEVAERSQTPVLDAIAAHARGAVALANGDAKAALEPLRFAFATWQGVGAPYIAARIRVLIARALLSLGDEEGARLERAAAQSVFHELGAGPDLLKLDVSERTSPVGSDRFGLTLREVQVLRMVASGSTNGAIAQELSLSVKTIDRHVSNIFVKIDVPTRAAATAFAYKHGLI